MWSISMVLWVWSWVVHTQTLVSQHQQIEPTAATEINLPFLRESNVSLCCTDLNVDVDDDNKLGADMKN